MKFMLYFKAKREGPQFFEELKGGLRRAKGPFFIGVGAVDRGVSMDVTAVVERTVEAVGFELVTMERAGNGLIRVFIDHPEGITVDDCVLVSDQLTRVFTVENIDYGRLEVSSPGMDRPLRKPEHFARFVGEKVKLKLRMARATRKVFQGTLLEVGAGGVKVLIDEGEAEFGFDEIDKANLVPAF